MKLEDQVCSLELSKRLKELGVKQESYFYWNCDEDHWTSKPCTDTSHWGIYPGDNEGGWSAFTVAELGEMLPKGIRSGKLDDDSFGCEWPEKHLQVYNLYDRAGRWTEADARAKMLIYLIEKGLVKP